MTFSAGYFRISNIGVGALANRLISLDYFVGVLPLAAIKLIFKSSQYILIHSVNQYST